MILPIGEAVGEISDNNPSFAIALPLMHRERLQTAFVSFLACNISPIHALTSTIATAARITALLARMGLNPNDKSHIDLMLAINVSTYATDEMAGSTIVMPADLYPTYPPTSDSPKNNHTTLPMLHPDPIPERNSPTMRTVGSM